MFKSFYNTIKLDIDIKSVLLLRVWTIFAGLVLILLIPNTLSQNEQGYYYTFLNLLSTQVFFELGLNNVLTQIAGHEAAHLSFENDSEPSGPVKHVKRLLSLFQFSKKIYSTTTIIFFIVISLFGLVFFKSDDSLGTNIWQYVWIVLVFLNAINLFFSPFLAGLEGIGFVSKVAKLRLFQSILGYLTLWVLLIFKFGLISILALPTAAVFLTAIWLFRRYRWLFANQSRIEKNDRISWKEEIFPFQWKIALSWLSGYFISQLFTPITFKYFGAVSAGKLGLSITIFTSVTALSFSWVNAKVPKMTHLLALNKPKEALDLFFTVLIRSSLLNLAIGLSFLFFVYTMQQFGFNIADRVSSLQILFFLMIASVTNNIVFSAAAFMRAHKKEPMLLNSVVTAVLISIGVFISSQISVILMISIYTAILVFVSLPWTILLFKKYYDQYST